jgi:bifunctional non-homologous end joining protein LigD
MPSRPKSRPGQLLDGEIMCLDGDGKPQFRAYCSVEANPAIAFDLLSLEGKDLRHLPLIQRKLRMHSIVASKGERLLYCDHVEQDGSGMFRLVCDSVSDAWSKRVTITPW